jgi:osmotically-inducible protein OsmY
LGLEALLYPFANNGSRINCCDPKIGAQRQQMVERLAVAAADVEYVGGARYYRGQCSSYLGQVDVNGAVPATGASSQARAEDTADYGT